MGREKKTQSQLFKSIYYDPKAKEARSSSADGVRRNVRPPAKLPPEPVRRVRTSDEDSDPDYDEIDGPVYARIPQRSRSRSPGKTPGKTPVRPRAKTPDESSYLGLYREQAYKLQTRYNPADSYQALDSNQAPVPSSKPDAEEDFTALTSNTGILFMPGKHVSLEDTYMTMRGLDSLELLRQKQRDTHEEEDIATINEDKKDKKTDVEN